MKLVVASRNPKKSAELFALLEDLAGIEILSLADFPNLPAVIEDGATFRENALKKARAAARGTGLLALADDSGLEVDALAGGPGVHSARFSGPEQNDARNRAKLLEALKGVPLERRTARFVCAVAVADPQGFEAVREGCVEGQIAFKERGSSGFGYDPLFIHPLTGKTFAELKPHKKNRVSHRSQALRLAKQVLREYSA